MTSNRGRGRNDEGGSDEGTITVQIVAASAVTRAGLAALVGADERFQVWGSFRNPTEAAHQTATAQGKPPDLIIAELEESSIDEVPELTKTQGTESPGPTVIALLPDWQPESIASLLRFGVGAVLPSTATGEEIMAALAAAGAGLVVIHRDALGVFEEIAAANEVDHESAAFDRQPLIESLTPREREVLGMMADGLGNKEIAWQLRISEHTVKFHVSSILAKLGASSRTEAVMQGLRQGLIMM
ncbi:MAG TPA: response regulator transcription factor [Pyrinomonadaceae bacterium]